tara:strand:- start:345 stop:893 length:549 start_codon:yes stop_codon:yes gene_type:complete
MNEEIEGSLLTSLRGYTLNSWYNHWNSILIEDLFKDHEAILPTVGLVKKIDFFINDVPFDLKVTYFPEQLLKDKLKDIGYGNELTNLKRICRALEIHIPNDLKDKALKLHLYNRVLEDQSLKLENLLLPLKHIKEISSKKLKQTLQNLKNGFMKIKVKQGLMHQIDFFSFLQMNLTCLIVGS